MSEAQQVVLAGWVLHKEAGGFFRSPWVRRWAVLAHEDAHPRLRLYADAHTHKHAPLRTHDLWHAELYTAVHSKYGERYMEIHTHSNDVAAVVCEDDDGRAHMCVSEYEYFNLWKGALVDAINGTFADTDAEGGDASTQLDDHGAQQQTALSAAKDATPAAGTHTHTHADTHTHAHTAPAAAVDGATSPAAAPPATIMSTSAAAAPSLGVPSRSLNGQSFVDMRTRADTQTHTHAHTQAHTSVRRGQGVAVSTRPPPQHTQVLDSPPHPPAEDSASPAAASSASTDVHTRVCESSDTHSHEHSEAPPAAVKSPARRPPDAAAVSARTSSPTGKSSIAALLATAAAAAVAGARAQQAMEDAASAWTRDRNAKWWAARHAPRGRKEPAAPESVGSVKSSGDHAAPTASAMSLSELRTNEEAMPGVVASTAPSMFTASLPPEWSVIPVLLPNGQLIAAATPSSAAGRFFPSSSVSAALTPASAAVPLAVGTPSASTPLPAAAPAASSPAAASELAELRAMLAQAVQRVTETEAHVAALARAMTGDGRQMRMAAEPTPVQEPPVSAIVPPVQHSASVPASSSLPLHAPPLPVAKQTPVPTSPAAARPLPQLSQLDVTRRPEDQTYTLPPVSARSARSKATTLRLDTIQSSSLASTVSEDGTRIPVSARSAILPSSPRASLQRFLADVMTQAPEAADVLAMTETGIRMSSLSMTSEGGAPSPTAAETLNTASAQVSAAMPTVQAEYAEADFSAAVTECGSVLQSAFQRISEEPALDGNASVDAFARMLLRYGILVRGSINAAHVLAIYQRLLAGRSRTVIVSCEVGLTYAQFIAALLIVGVLQRTLLAVQHADTPETSAIRPILAALQAGLTAPAAEAPPSRRSDSRARSTSRSHSRTHRLSSPREGEIVTEPAFGGAVPGILTLDTIRSLPPVLPRSTLLEWSTTGQARGIPGLQAVLRRDARALTTIFKHYADDRVTHVPTGAATGHTAYSVVLNRDVLTVADIVRWAVEFDVLPAALTQVELLQLACDVAVVDAATSVLVLDFAAFEELLGRIALLAFVVRGAQRTRADSAPAPGVTPAHAALALLRWLDANGGRAAMLRSKSRSGAATHLRFAARTNFE